MIGTIANGNGATANTWKMMGIKQRIKKIILLMDALLNDALLRHYLTIIIPNESGSSPKQKSSSFLF